MKNIKMILLILLILILVGSLGYLAYLIQDGTNPLTLLNLRASNVDEEIDPFLAENDLTSDPIEDSGTSPSPTDLLAYNSTSPTVSPTGSATASATLTVTVSPSLTPTSSPTPTIVNVAQATETPIPTIIQKLPQSGITDHLNTFAIGAGVLILIGLFL